MLTRTDLQVQQGELNSKRKELEAKRFELTKDINKQIWDVQKLIDENRNDLQRLSKSTKGKRQYILRVEFVNMNYRFSDETGFYGWLMDGLATYGKPVSVEVR